MFTHPQADALQEQQAAVFNKYARRQAHTLGFELDLGGAANHTGLTWKVLPGVFDSENFQAAHEFQYLGPVPSLAQLQDIATLRNRYAGYFNNSWVVDGVVGTLGSRITGCTYGILGAWLTVDTAVYRINAYEGPVYYKLTDMTEVANPVEYNGHLFFSARQGASCTPAIGYIPPLFTREEQKHGTWAAPKGLAQYFSIEDLGECGSVGVYNGGLIVVTTRGAWEVRALGEQAHYALGRQLWDWHLTPQAVIAVTNSHVAALDRGNLYIYSEAVKKLYAGTRFTSLKANASQLVLGTADHVAVSNGDGFEAYQGYTAKGMALVRTADGACFSPERAPRQAVGSVELVTCTAVFPAYMEVREVLTSPDYTAVIITTERATYSLRPNNHNPGQWMAGYGGKQLQLTFAVPSDVDVPPPTVYLSPRSSS